MKIVIARHGETDWNAEKRLMGQTDIHLNENGRKQAKSLKEELKSFNFDICFSSPLARAKETAEIICDSKCEIICDADLSERYLIVSHNGLLKNLQYLILEKTAPLDYTENNLKNCEYKVFDIKQ